jgi:hypothetical protein
MPTWGGGAAVVAELAGIAAVERPVNCDSPSSQWFARFFAGIRQSTSTVDQGATVTWRAVVSVDRSVLP